VVREDTLALFPVFVELEEPVVFELVGLENAFVSSLEEGSPSVVAG